MRRQRLAIVLMEELIEDALSIALANNRTVYDSLYIALAVQKGVGSRDGRRTAGKRSRRSSAGQVAGRAVVSPSISNT